MGLPRSSLFLVGILFLLVVAGPAIAVMQPVNEGWEYRWGDSPFNDKGVPLWTLADEPEQWQAIGFPSNPPDRAGRSHVWFRVTLPDDEWQAPVLYIYSVDIITQVWFDGRMIYQYGTFDEQGRGRFEGWPWHEIPLPADYHDQPLYFRVYSNYIDIGLWGEVAVMNHAGLVLHILGNSLKSLIVAGFSVLIALLALLFAVLQSDRKSFASLALFALSSALMLLAESQASQLLWHAPLFWDYLAAGSYYMLPVAMALMLGQWLADHRPWLINLVWKVHLLYLAGALALALAGAIDLSSTFPPFDALLLVSLVTMALVAVRRFRQLTGEQRALMLAFGVFSALLVIDMAVAHGVLAWQRVPVSFGSLFFSLTVVLVSLWHYAATQHELKRLNASLEQKVSERTTELEAMARREQARARLLAFENAKGRVLQDVIAELQGCRSVNQGFAVLARAMPGLCSPLQGALYQHKDGGYERISCWGYTDSAEPGLLLDTRQGLPEPTRPPAGTPDDHGSLRFPLESLTGRSWCLWLNLQHARHGIETAGLLFVTVDPELVSEESDYGTTRLFSALDQAIQKIGITLSGISLQEELQRYSYEDALTGLRNRRFFDELLAHEGKVAQRNQSPLSVLIADIDWFKHFNDSYGHEAGDAALRLVARTLAGQFRESDVVCRFGGEEFVVIMPGATAADARERASALLRAVSDVPIIHQGRSLGYLTVSAGIATWPDCGKSPMHLLGLADEALYRAKQRGRNRVEV